MIESIEIRGLRGVREAKLEGLKPLTIFVGPNGCGKSTVLEAAGVACAGESPDAAFRALASREWLGLEGMSYWCDPKQGARVIARFEQTTPAAIESVVSIAKELDENLLSRARAEGEKGEFLSLSVHYGFFARTVLVNADGVAAWYTPARPLARYATLGTFAERSAGARRRLEAPRFSSALRQALGAIKQTPWYEDFVRYLREIRPNLDTIESSPVGDRDEPFIFEKNPRVWYPVAYAGDGFRRALLLASTLAEAKGGVAALDEPEAFAHPKMEREIARLFRRALDDGTQILVSTHSLEFIATVLDELKDVSERFAVVGLRMAGGVLDPIVISGADAHRRVVELGDDLRI